MATIAAHHRPAKKSIAPDRYERILAYLVCVLLTVLLVAIARGEPHWHAVPRIVWFHLATILTALSITPFLLLQRRGTRIHRRLGWVWATAMFATAIGSLFIRRATGSGWSPIHVLSALTIVFVPWLVLRARKHDVPGHRRAVRGTVTGALIIAGFFTLPFGRMLGTWLLG
jgi:uncharacterized membrane protein